MQLEQAAAEPDIRQMQTMNVITMLDLTNREALVALLNEYRGKVKPVEDEELVETALKAISKKTGYTLDEILDAYAPIISDELGTNAMESLYSLILTINEKKLKLLVDLFNKMQKDNSNLTPAAILYNIDMAERQDYWREGELQRTYAFALRRGKIVIPES